ncbi:hypothetical protein TNCV_4286881 [Trichonephila clavipes]|nr:hypothetical protein TNCV_4286881 [Trichonephila clavipes]
MERDSSDLKDPDIVLIRVESRIEGTIDRNEFRSKEAVVTIPDAEFSIILRSVTKNTTPCSTRIRKTTICVNNQGLIEQIGSRVERNQTTVMRIYDRWMQDGTTDGSGRSHAPQCPTSRENRQIVRMAVTDR